MAEDGSKFLLGQDRVEEFWVEIRESRGGIAGDHPVAVDADYAGGGILGGGYRDVRIHVWETWMFGTPGDFGFATVTVVGIHLGVDNGGRVLVATAVAAGDACGPWFLNKCFVSRRRRRRQRVWIRGTSKDGRCDGCFVIVIMMLLIVAVVEFLLPLSRSGITHNHDA